LQALISKHWEITGSTVAARVLNNWYEFLPKFVKIIPFEYKKVLEEEKLRELQRKLQLTEEQTSRHE
jgi:glutamate synthase (NADPH/NADH) large chain